MDDNTSVKERNLNFSEALIAMKTFGIEVSRRIWPDTITVQIQFPDKNSKMTEPYIYMKKKVLVAEEGQDSYYETKMFPLDVSTESIFAED